MDAPRNPTARAALAARGGQRARLLWVCVLCAAVTLGEGVGGFLAGSLALLSDALHTFTHFFAAALSYLAILQALRPAEPHSTYRNWRIEVLAALFNGLLLIPLVLFLLWEAYQRARNPVPISAAPMIGLAATALVVNVISAMILHRHSRDDINVRGAYLHMLTDAAASVGVIVAGVLVALTRHPLVDPIVSGAISLMMLVWCFRLIRESSRILLEYAPDHIPVDELRREIARLAENAEVHDLHVWTITSRMYAMTAHLRVRRDLAVSQTEDLARLIRDFVKTRYDINHVTIQFDGAPHDGRPCEPLHAPGITPLPPPP